MARSAAVRERTLEKSRTPDRLRFVLSGPSRPLDLRRNAARRDLADIELAGRWFAPHYAVPERWLCHADHVPLRITPSSGAETVGALAAGESFAVLEVSGDWAWGYRELDKCVGYAEAGALKPAPLPA